MSDKIAINALENELADAAAFCRERGLGLEVTAFAFPDGLDRDFERRIETHQNYVEGIAPLTFHGPFLDLYPASVDAAVVEVARDRHERALEAAHALGARVYVAHVGSIPLIRNPRYRDHFVGATVDFWLPFAEQAQNSGMVIALENLWEATPELQRDIVQQAENPGLRASFDNGHNLVFGEVSSAAWVARLGESLVHCHLHDNDGSEDQHLPVGKGSEDWSALLSAIRSHAPRAIVVLESDSLEQNQVSLEAVGRLMDLGEGD